MNGVYGATKFIGEKAVVEFSKMNPLTKYLTVRYGNVFRSTGSFIFKWEKAVEEGREIVLTDPDATRFFFPVEGAVDLVLAAVSRGAEGLLIPKIKAVSMGTVAEAFDEVHGKDGRTIAWKTIGLQPGENKHETMDGEQFSNEVAQYTKDEFKEIFLCPTK